MKIINIAFVITFLFITSVVIAEEEVVNVSIQSISCSDKRADKKPISCDKKVEKLKGKLSHLPYQTFKEESMQKASLKKDKKETIELVDGDTLGLELLYLENGRLGLVVDWKDGKGMQILDTRMHFDMNEVMLAGADSPNGEHSGKILAISLEK